MRSFYGETRTCAYLFRLPMCGNNFILDDIMVKIYLILEFNSKFLIWKNNIFNEAKF